MKKFYKTSSLIVACILIMSSCSVSKRHYMRGHYVQWHASKHTGSTVAVKENKKQIAYPQEDLIIPHIKKDPIPLAEKKKNVDVLKHEETNSQPSANNKEISLISAFAKDKIATNDARKILTKELMPGSAGGSGTNKGLKMIIMGLLLILLGYVFFFALGFNALGYLIFLIFTIGGGIYALIGLYFILFG